MKSPSALLALLTLPGLSPAADQPLRIPDWFTPYPGASQVTRTSSAVAADLSYTAPAATDAVIRHYQDQLGKAEMTFQADFDGIGTTIRISEETRSCVVRINEQDEGVAVNASCALPTAAVFSPIIPEPPPPAPVAESKLPSAPASGSRTVHYLVEGTAKRVSVTYKNASGATEQKTVIPPFELSFQAPAGATLFLSAQKIRVTERNMIDDDPKAVIVVANGIDGKVRAAIRVNGKLFQEANTSSPRGVATVGGAVPEQP
jgi:hypothetical protein